MKTYTGILIFLTGAAVGAVGSLFYLRGDYKKKLDEAVGARDMAIRELKRENQRLDHEAEMAVRTVNSKVSTELSKHLGYTMDDSSALVRNERRERSDASERVSGGRKDVVYSIDENGFPDEGEPRDPYGISTEDFLMTKKEYDKTTLLYYDIDGTLSTEDGDVVEDIDYILGENWKAEIGRYEDAIAYIRNEKASTDYEVIVEQKEYGEDWATS